MTSTYQYQELQLELLQLLIEHLYETYQLYGFETSSCILQIRMTAGNCSLYFSHIEYRCFQII